LVTPECQSPLNYENEIICWHFDHKENRAVKGINLLSAFYHSEKGGQTVRLPGYRVIAKNEVKFTYILADS